MLSKSSTLLWFSSPVFSVMSMKRQCYLKNAVQDHYSNHYYPFPAMCSLICPQRGNTTLKMLSKSCTYYSFPALCSMSVKRQSYLKDAVQEYHTIILFSPAFCHVHDEATVPYRCCSRSLFKSLLSFLALHSLSRPWQGNTTLKMLFKITIQITMILFQPCILCYVCEEATLP